MFEMFEVTFEVYIEDKKVQTQTMQAPKEMLEMNFIQLVRQISNDPRPMKIRMYRPEIIWDSFENKQKVIDNEVIFSNHSMVAWQEKK